MASVSLVTVSSCGSRPQACQGFFQNSRATRDVCATQEISMLEAFFLVTLIGAVACLIAGAIDDARGG
jgi:hypothetical protein